MVKTIYMLSVDYGADIHEMAFSNETIRNELALAFTEELATASFNLDVDAWYNQIGSGLTEEMALQFAIQENKDWYMNPYVCTWEVPLYEED